MHKYGCPAMADIASCFISDELVKQHLLSPLEKDIDCSHIPEILRRELGLKWHKTGEIFNHL